MTEREGGQWNVAVKNKAVHVQRVSDSGEQLFDDLLDPDEARQLGELLTKHAGKSVSRSNPMTPKTTRIPTSPSSQAMTPDDEDSDEDEESEEKSDQSD